MIKAYVTRFSSKVQRETEAEKQRVLERLKWSLERLVEEGLAIQGMLAEACGQHLGKTVVKLRWLFALPFHQFTVGDHMVLSRVDPLKEAPLHALFLDATTEEIRVLMSEVPNFTGLWRIDKWYNTTIYEQMRRLLANMELYPRVPVMPLCDVFLQPDTTPSSSTACGPSAIDWARDTLGWLDSPSRRKQGDDWGLNASQLKAAANSILSRFSLIHGPPGTGKTYTLCRFIKLIVFFKAPIPVLACAKTNAGVDHLLEQLILLGLQAVCVGQSQKEELKRYSLETLVHKHPLSASIEQELKQLVALKSRLRGIHAQVCLVVVVLLNKNNKTGNCHKDHQKGRPDRSKQLKEKEKTVCVF